MRAPKIITSCALFALLIFNAALVSAYNRKFDEFGNINCEDEMARLDNYAVAMSGDPEARGYIFVYGGRSGRRGEAQARLTRIKNYLVGRRGLKADRLVMINGGFREDLWVEIYLVPLGATPPTATPTLEPKDVRFKKGRIKRWELNCTP